jgi:hypothetical protein
LGREAVIDTEPRETGVGERFEEGLDVGAFAAFVEAAAMNENGSGERAGTVGNVKIQQDGLAVGLRIFNVFLVERRGK